MGVALSPVIDAPHASEPVDNCSLCPRLVLCRSQTDIALPATPLGPSHARVLIVSLAPDHERGPQLSFLDSEAEALLYATLTELGFAETRVNDNGEATVIPVESRIVSAIRCPAPAGVPQPSEVATCNQFLRSELQTMPNLRIVVTLGVLAHNATLAACGVPLSRVSFQNGQITGMPDGLKIANSYYLSRHTLNTGQVSPAHFRNLMTAVRQELDNAS
ncbi:uracil-DNA glycosylase family protein [Acetobacter conturbans]|uniref:Uracil-DNA glycosylase n=1 Tax=Acetobacter conturbans TaxID=1737472 RepID=A0ABX0JX85_9PROT|nr:uracil-DNA glycosylase family protein [Acetobacter conturbans]NHN87878.1 uracil-DNA glycosylase [Acetobacter conturbans]